MNFYADGQLRQHVKVMIRFDAEIAQDRILNSTIGKMASPIFLSIFKFGGFKQAGIIAIINAKESRGPKDLFTLSKRG